MENILEHLNEAQRKAVENINGPTMVIAGAGSGKTRVLTYRVAHLLNCGVDAFNILALTFTNKAAREMKDRISSLVKDTDAVNVWMGTFHSIFARILRIEGHRLGFTSNFTIYDTDDSKSLIRSIVKEQGLDNKIYTTGYVLHRISSAKTSLISAQEYISNPELMNSDKVAGKSETGKLFVLYSNRCKKANAMDFDDLLYYTNIVLRDFPDALLKYQKKFRYILVDEYQDTNYAQYLIIKKLAAREENICVVGDDAQSIYAFRGANIQNILNFKSDYPDLKVFKLEQNYRSTKNIVNAANSIIKNNQNQITKEIWTKNDEGNKIKLLKANTDNEEGALIANSIFEAKMNYQLKNECFAILYRTNAQSRSFEESLRKLNIAYRIYGGISFYKRKEIRDLLGYYRLVINHNDEEALLRTVNYPARGIGKTTLEKIIVSANNLNKSLWEVIENINSCVPEINTGTRKKLLDFSTMIKSFAVGLKTKNAFDLAKHIASSTGILKDLYEDKSPEGMSRFENIEELLNAIKEFSEKENNEVILVENELKNNGVRTLEEFMQDIALLTDADTNDKDNTDTVSLMTIHAAKGLEFPYVYIVGMEENLFPSIQSLGAREDLEEERRLFYVALTRAEKQSTISYANSRYRWGNLTVTEPSRFIDEIDERFLEMSNKLSLEKGNFVFDNNKETAPFVKQTINTINKKNLKKVNQVASAADNALGLDLQAGMKVIHERFGEGKVLNLEGTGPNKKATIFFQKVGQKNLLLRFAKLEVIE